MKTKLLLPILFFTALIPISGQSPKGIDSLKRQLLIQKDSLKMGTFNALIQASARQEPEETKIYIQQALNWAATHPNKSYQASIQMTAGRWYAMQGKYRDAQDVLEEARTYFKSIEDSTQLAKTNNNLSMVLFYQGDLEGALATALAAAKINESISNNKKDLIGNYMAVGNVLSTLERYENSLDYYQKAATLAKELKADLRLAQVRHNLGENMKWLKRYNEAIPYFEQNISYYTKTDNSFKLATTYNSLGTVYFESGAYDEAKNYFTKSYQITKRLGDSTGMAFNARNLGRLRLKANDPAGALSYYLQGMLHSQKTNSRGILVADYRNVSDAYAALGDYQKAYAFRVKHQEINDSIYNQETSAKLNELELKYKTAKKEAALAKQDQEIEALNAQTEKDRLTKMLYGIGITALFIIGLLMIYGFKQRLKKNEIARKKQEEIYQKEIAYKKKELASQTLHLVQKNTFIQELRENLERIKSSPELFKIEFRRLVLLLKRESAEDKDWEIFKSYFSEVHNDFDHKIRAVAKDITEKEIRLAAFLRMNLSTKEIASMFNVLPESVLKSKYRLKKKLALDKDMDLNRYLLNL